MAGSLSSCIPRRERNCANGEQIADSSLVILPEAPEGISHEFSSCFLLMEDEKECTGEFGKVLWK